MTATVDGRQIRVGGPHLLEEEGVTELPVAEEWREAGAIILHVVSDGQVVGALRLADEIRAGVARRRSTRCTPWACRSS